MSAEEPLVCKVYKWHRCRAFEEFAGLIVGCLIIPTVSRISYADWSTLTTATSTPCALLIVGNAWRHVSQEDRSQIA